MRDEHRCDVISTQDGLDFLAHLCAHTGIKVAERLVQKHRNRASGKGSGEGDTLLLSTRKLVRVSAVKPGQSDQFKHLGKSLTTLVARHSLKPEGHVLSDSHVRKQGVFLKHHPDVSAVWRYVIRQARHALALDGDFAGVQILEACDEAEQGSLAASAGAKNGQYLARL